MSLHGVDFWRQILTKFVDLWVVRAFARICFPCACRLMIAIFEFAKENTRRRRIIRKRFCDTQMFKGSTPFLNLYFFHLEKNIFHLSKYFVK